MFYGRANGFSSPEKSAFKVGFVFRKLFLGWDVLFLNNSVSIYPLNDLFKQGTSMNMFLTSSSDF